MFRTLAAAALMAVATQAVALTTYAADKENAASLGPGDMDSEAAPGAAPTEAGLA